MATKTISNLFSNFDEMGTEANAEIIKNSISSSKKMIVKANSKKILDEIFTSSKPINNKLETLAAKLPKKIVDKKSPFQQLILSCSNLFSIQYPINRMNP